MKMSKFIKGFKKYLGIEITIEYKACLYFYGILTFYCIYLICQKTYFASILHMCEMILAAYFMGYLQIYVLHNFDEAEKLGKREIISITLCSILYAAFSFLLGWFDRKIEVTCLYFLFTLFMYWCVYLINKMKRAADTDKLNRMLAEFKKGEPHGEEDR
ncbi:MAG: DUF3021 family protein [Lachnospiraceae bacterium]|nr:DUF3021 family protein [Lachnospiraceae bacterium]